jgi:hypothetical protein
MKIELEKDGTLKIIAETVVEAWALNAVWPPGSDICEKCNSTPHKIIIDCSILLDR